MIETVLKPLYDRFVRSHLPYKIGIYSGIPVRGTVRELDFTDEFPHYKQKNIYALKKTVNTDDNVLIIGGGIGVTAVISAKCVGDCGSVTIYEASANEVETISRTLDINQVDHLCSVHHTYIGEVIDVTGQIGDADQISPSDLPPCDIIEMDCEGAEIKIIPNLAVSPRAIVVETHPEFGSPTDRVKRELKNIGYKVVTEAPDPVDGHVLTAEKTSD